MRKYIYLLLVVCVTLNSCIKQGLDDFPEYDEVLITDFDLEYRYVTTNANDVEQLSVITLVTDVIFDEESGTIIIDAAVPAATVNFPEQIRSQVNLTNITGYAKLSPAASIQPLNGAPVLGQVGDYSSPAEYKVLAADGKTTKKWIVTVNSLTF